MKEIPFLQKIFGRNFEPMTKPLNVEWTERSLKNAKSIKTYLLDQFTEKEAQDFESLLEDFERNVAIFPQLYPQSTKYPKLRRAVLHKFTSVFYSIKSTGIVVIAMQDNRQDKPGK